MHFRVGIGHDTHRVGPGGPLRLGGLDIPWDRSLIGHSDADVLLHAITDAILGAASLGDIGELFPDIDPANKNRDSADMLARAYGAAVMAGWRIVNVDCIVFAQKPKLSEHKAALRAKIASILGIHGDAVGLKAKTGEGVDAVGREEAIQAQAVVLLEKP